MEINDYPERSHELIVIHLMMMDVHQLLTMKQFFAGKK